jgi:RNA polymerase primary sigma factor
MIWGSRLREKREGAVIATDSVVEMEEMQGVLASGRDRGFVTAASLQSAIEEAELSSAQARHLLSYLEEHGVEIVDADEPDEPAAELEAGGEARESAAGSDAGVVDESDDAEEESDEEARGVRARLQELKQAEADLSADPSLDSLRLYLRSIGRVPLLTADEEVVLAKRI